jgi:hypothetical protein
LVSGEAHLIGLVGFDLPNSHGFGLRAHVFALTFFLNRRLIVNIDRRIEYSLINAWVDNAFISISWVLWAELVTSDVLLLKRLIFSEGKAASKLLRSSPWIRSQIHLRRDVMLSWYSFSQGLLV